MDDELKKYGECVAELTLRIISNVDDFNAHFSGCEDNFLFGNCYWYARILQERFSAWFNTDIMYNQIENHFCCRIKTAAGSFLADIRGVFATGEPDDWMPWIDYITVEPLDAARVYRDCIWHLEEDQWTALPQSFRSDPWNLGISALMEQDYNPQHFQESQK